MGGGCKILKVIEVLVTELRVLEQRRDFEAHLVWLPRFINEESVAERSKTISEGFFYHLPSLVKIPSARK